MKTIIYYEVKAKPNNGTIGKDSNYSFETEQEAVDMATEFKANPRSHNPNMTDENVAYWQRQDYAVIKTIKTVEEIKTI